MLYYTNIFQHKGKLYLRGRKNGKPFKDTIKYKPYLFIRSNKDPKSKYRTIHDEIVSKVDFDSIWDAKEFVKKYENLDNFDIYGLTNFQYSFLYDTFSGDIEYDPQEISVCSLDIETKLGTTDIATAIQTTPNEITAITISRHGHKDVFGCKEFRNDRDDVTYHKCKDEKELLLKFVSKWSQENYFPDVVTGWNVEFFDIPYLVGRIIRILGDEYANKLSPWGIITPYEIIIKGRKVNSFELKGVSVLDYMNLYKKFRLKPRESYKLDYIAEVELDTKKVDYRSEGYSNLDDLYERNYQLYIEYNIKDVELIDQLENQLRYIELVFAMAYTAKINYGDTLGTVLQWDVLIHNFLMDKNVVVSPQKKSLSSDIAGGYVKEPVPGMYKWVLSFDLNSLYPHLIMQYNISPDVFVKRLSSFPTIEQILDGADIPEKEYSVAANGCVYSKNKRGFLSEIMKGMYDSRTKFKGQMLDAEQQYERTKDKKYKVEASRFNSFQHAMKINLNSAYGALLNQWFRWFDPNHGEAITMSGQLSIKWIAKKINHYMNKVCKTEEYDYIVASDTDSIYVDFSKIVSMKFNDETDKLKIVRWLDKLAQEVIEPLIDKSYQELADQMHAYEQKMKMKREAIADTAIWTAKKKYVMNVWNSEGVEYSEPQLKMVGIQAIQSSTPNVCRGSIKETLKIVMQGDESKVQSYIADFKEKFKKMSFEEIASPRGVTNIDDYKPDTKGMFIKGTPIHAKGSILYNRLLKEYNLGSKYEAIGNGDKIKYCYLKQPNPYGVNVISCTDELPKEFNLHAYLDYDTQFEKAFLKPVTNILDHIGWKAEKVSTLEDFFG